MPIDKTDKILLDLLQKDSDRPIKELAQHLNLTIAPVHERIKKLKREGFISRTVAIAERKQLNLSIMAITAIRVEKHSQKELQDFEEKILQYPEVLECYQIAGNYDFILKIVGTNMESYHEFLREKIGLLPSVQHINTQFVIKPVKEETALPL